MKMEGEIISREYIKPSSPTPQQCRIHNLSLLDQILPPIFIPLVLYYPINSENSTNNISDQFISQTTQTLKKSLSKTLSRFYPFAGRIRDNLSIDCNDEGVLFVISKFHGSLLGFLKKPNPEACRAHIPGQLTFEEPEPGSNVAMIQVNYFDCGGIAIGSIFFHKVADAVTFGTFIKAWAKLTSLGDQYNNIADDDNYVETLLYPNYKPRSFFPHNKSMQRESHLYSAMRKYFKVGKTVMRRYVFDSSAISKLRAQLSDDSPKSRVEVVSAFLWKCFMVASAAAAAKESDILADHDSISLVTHVMNIRRKAECPFPENSFGNFVWLVPASTVNDEAHRDFKHLSVNLRSALINKIDADLIKRMQGDEGFSGYLKNLEDCWSGFPDKADYLSMSSWCNFGLYNVDFGWGKPVWITACNAGCDIELPFFNTLWLMDTRQGDGIEAWLTMDQQYFAEFDKIKEISDFAFIDPSPLN